MAVIAVTRGLGSGGEEIAFHVAERLGVQFLDREIIQAVASEAGVSAETLKDVERGPSLLDRMLDYLSHYPAEDGFHWPTETGIRPVDGLERYRKLVATFVRSVADREPCVIVGHGSTGILRDHPRVLRCLFVASNDIRVRRVMAEYGVDAKTADKRIKEFDQAWSNFLKTYHGIEWLHPRHYDLVLHTDRMSLKACEDIVIAAAKAIDEMDV